MPGDLLPVVTAAKHGLIDVTLKPPPGRIKHWLPLRNGDEHRRQAAKLAIAVSFSPNP